MRAVAPAMSLLACAEDSVHCITEWLDVYSIMNLKDTCRQLHKVCKPKGHAWHTVDIRAKKLTFLFMDKEYPYQYFHWFPFAIRAFTGTKNLNALALGMPKLRFLHLKFADIHTLTPLSTLPSLQTLELYGVNLDDKGRSLGDLPSLTSLSLNDVFSHDGSAPKYSTWINKLPKLKRLCISSCFIEDEEKAWFDSQVQEKNYEELCVDFIDNSEY